MPRVKPASVTYRRASRRSYLDIETSWAKTITVIGVFRPDLGTRQWVAPKLDAAEIMAYLDGVEVLFTYNGARFDLPVILGEMGLDLAAAFRHHDLMYDCWARSLYGGLKKVEKTLGIQRDIEGVDGYAALGLWDRFKKDGDAEALEVLLRYNREDIENLERLAVRIGVVDAEQDLFPAVFGGRAS